jgi:hypothetical protein
MGCTSGETAIKVHSLLGLGLLESAYEQCFAATNCNPLCGLSGLRGEIFRLVTK